MSGLEWVASVCGRISPHTTEHPVGHEEECVFCGDDGCVAVVCWAQPLGWRLAAAGHDLLEFASGNEASCLAWNLCIASLLCAAEERQRRRQTSRNP